MTRRPTSVRLNGCLLTASLILLALNLANGHPRGAIYALLAVTAFGLLLAVGIRENRATRGPQVPLGAPERDRDNH